MISAYIGSQDFNTITTPGSYRFDCGNPNGPPICWGQLLVIYGGADTVTQIAGDYATGNLWTRSGNPPNAGGGGSWKAWNRQVRTDGDTMTGNLSVPDVYLQNIGQWASGINKFAGGYGVNAYVAYNVCGQGASVEYWNSPNPYTGGYSCPAGYADMRLTKIQYCLHTVGTMSYEMHLCYR